MHKGKSSYFFLKFQFYAMFADHNKTKLLLYTKLVCQPNGIILRLMQFRPINFSVQIFILIYFLNSCQWYTHVETTKGCYSFQNCIFLNKTCIDCISGESKCESVSSSSTTTTTMTTTTTKTTVVGIKFKVSDAKNQEKYSLCTKQLPPLLYSVLCKK